MCIWSWSMYQIVSLVRTVAIFRREQTPVIPAALPLGSVLESDCLSKCSPRLSHSHFSSRVVSCELDVMCKSLLKTMTVVRQRDWRRIRWSWLRMMTTTTQRLWLWRQSWWWLVHLYYGWYIYTTDGTFVPGMVCLYYGWCIYTTHGTFVLRMLHLY